MPFSDTNEYSAFEDTENYIETQTKILQSETLALTTIKSLDLARYPEFGGGARNPAGHAATTLDPQFWARFSGVSVSGAFPTAA